MSIFEFNKNPDPYAVMGNPISHSKSPYIHQQFAIQNNQDIIYQAIQVDLGGFSQAVGNFFANGGKGLNITVPFKQEAYHSVDKLSQCAKTAGAVNTISIKPDGSSYGDNTDGVGLVRDLCINHSLSLKDKRVLILGAGGATRGIIEPLLLANVREIVIVNRTLHKAEDIAKSFFEFATGQKVSAINYESLDHSRKFDLIINATSASLRQEIPPLAEEHITSQSYCYDMMYASSATHFMQWAQRLGAPKVIDGLGMLVEQAAESFRIWRGVKPETKSIIALLRENM